MRIDRGAGCGAAPRRLPGRRSRPPFPFFRGPPLRPSQPRAPPVARGDGGHRTAPLQQPHHHTRTPSLPVCPPLGWRSPAPGVCPRGCPRCGVPKAPKGPPRGPAASPGLCCPPGCRGFGVCSGRCSRCTLREGTLPKVSSCRQGNLFGRAVKKKKKSSAHAQQPAQPCSPLPSAGKGCACLRSPPSPARDRFIYFFFFRARSTGSLLGTSASPHAAVPWETRQKSAVQGHGCAPALEQSALCFLTQRL